MDITGICAELPSDRQARVRPGLKGLSVQESQEVSLPPERLPDAPNSSRETRAEKIRDIKATRHSCHLRDIV